MDTQYYRDWGYASYVTGTWADIVTTLDAFIEGCRQAESDEIMSTFEPELD